MSSRRSAKATRAELERRLEEIRAQENRLKTRIHRLECSIVSTPSLEMERRIHWRDTLPPDEDMVAARRRTSSVRSTRLQVSIDSGARSRQALTALALVLLFCFFAWWFWHQLVRHGIVPQ